MSFQLPAGMRPAQAPQKDMSEEERAQQQQQQQQREEMKRQMIQAMLEPEARERLSRISLTRPQLAQQVEEILVRMGSGGQIRGKVSDEALKGLLEQVSSSSQPKPQSSAPERAGTRRLGGGITIQRKRDDSDSDEYDL